MNFASMSSQAESRVASLSTESFLCFNRISPLTVRLTLSSPSPACIVRRCRAASASPCWAALSSKATARAVSLGTQSPRWRHFPTAHISAALAPSFSASATRSSAPRRIISIPAAAGCDCTFSHSMYAFSRSPCAHNFHPRSTIVHWSTASITSSTTDRSWTSLVATTRTGLLSSRSMRTPNASPSRLPLVNHRCRTDVGNVNFILVTVSRVIDGSFDNRMSMANRRIIFSNENTREEAERRAQGDLAEGVCW
mmetsp:Transcript_24611/g.79187  ORF Transcript_24611/g.79187 Transcript_24611/m.79187 type:complete len:253 (+) Transcript_24611:472-1230(+)